MAARTVGVVLARKLQVSSLDVHQLVPIAHQLRFEACPGGRAPGNDDEQPRVGEFPVTTCSAPACIDAGRRV
jgi:hypothetical protein